MKRLPLYSKTDCNIFGTALLSLYGTITLDCFGLRLLYSHLEGKRPILGNRTWQSCLQNADDPMRILGERTQVTLRHNASPNLGSDQPSL